MTRDLLTLTNTLTIPQSIRPLTAGFIRNSENMLFLLFTTENKSDDKNVITVIFMHSIQINHNYTPQSGMKIHECSCSFVFAVFNNLNETRVRVRSCSTFSKKWVFVFGISWPSTLAQKTVHVGSNDRTVCLNLKDVHFHLFGPSTLNQSQHMFPIYEFCFLS